MNAVTITPPRRELIPTSDAVPLLDTSRFEHMNRIASAMAASRFIPEALRSNVPQETVANCFAVVSQAVRWNMDPFAVAQCVSMVHGRPCYEGKLVHAVLQAKLQVELLADYEGETGKDAFGIVVYDAERPERKVRGTVGAWATADKQGKRNRAWVADPELMLWYRGVRTWARRYEPALLLGVYTDDELEDLQENQRASRARDVTPPRVSRPGPAEIAPPEAPQEETKPDLPQTPSSPPPPNDPPSTMEAKPTRPSGPPRATRPAPPPAAAPSQFDTADDGPLPDATIEDTTDVEAMVREFEECSTTAQTMDDLEDCAEALQPYVNGDLSHTMPRELATRAQNAWEAAQKRIAHAHTVAGGADDEENPERIELLDLAREAADQGEKRFKLWLGKLSVERHSLLTEQDVAALKQRAARAKAEG